MTKTIKHSYQITRPEVLSNAWGCLITFGDNMATEGFEEGWND